VVRFWQRQDIFLFFKNGPDHLGPPSCLLVSGYLVKWLGDREYHVIALVLRVRMVVEIPSLPLVLYDVHVDIFTFILVVLI
jgi:hypothetical protein